MIDAFSSIADYFYPKIVGWLYALFEYSDKKEDSVMNYSKITKLTDRFLKLNRNKNNKIIESTEPVEKVLEDVTKNEDQNKVVSEIKQHVDNFTKVQKVKIDPKQYKQTLEDATILAQEMLKRGMIKKEKFEEQVNVIRAWNNSTVSMLAKKLLNIDEKNKKSEVIQKSSKSTCEQELSPTDQFDLQYAEAKYEFFVCKKKMKKTDNMFLNDEMRFTKEEMIKTTIDFLKAERNFAYLSRLKKENYQDCF